MQSLKQNNYIINYYENNSNNNDTEPNTDIW